MVKTLFQLNRAIKRHLPILLIILNICILDSEHYSQKNSCLNCNIRTNCKVLHDAFDRAVAVMSASSAAFLDSG